MSAADTERGTEWVFSVDLSGGGRIIRSLQTTLLTTAAPPGRGNSGPGNRGGQSPSLFPGLIRKDAKSYLVRRRNKTDQNRILPARFCVPVGGAVVILFYLVVK